MKSHDNEAAELQIALKNAFYARHLSEIEGLNFLTRQGLLSDNVVWVSDIAIVDLQKALQFMNDL